MPRESGLDMQVMGVTRVGRWLADGEEAADDLIAGETAIALTYNQRSHVVMMATPTDLEDLALGFSLTEGIIMDPAELLSTRVIERGDGIELALTVAPAAAERLEGQRRNLTGRTGCGLCGAESLAQAVRLPAAVGDGLRVGHEALQRALEGLSARQPLQAATGAVHGAAWCTAAGSITALREDVGRHNALDKLIGHLARAGEEPATGFVLVSSRASYEMVLKAASFGAELLLAVSAPTTMAVALARHCGLTLVGFARPGRHNVYTGSRRLTESQEKP